MDIAKNPPPARVPRTNPTRRTPLLKLMVAINPQEHCSISDSSPMGVKEAL